MDPKTKKITIPVTLTIHEWCRLYHMFQHISEEAHDDSDNSEPWYEEEWWNEISYFIEDQLKKNEITRYDIYTYKSQKKHD